MIASLFTELVSKYFKLVVGQITELINGEAAEPTMLHKTMLTEEYSPDLTWGSTEINQSIVAADVVSLESSLPLKKRGSLGVATGQIPKLGIKYERGEKAITDINVMRARGADEATVAGRLLDDAGKCIKAMDVRKEIMFEQALSTGTCLISDGTMYDGNDGTGIRANYGYKTENLMNAATTWGDTGYTPITDLRTMFDAAEAAGNTINHLYMARTAFDKIRTSEEGKVLSASFQGLVITQTGKLPVPSRSVFEEALRDEFGAEVHIVSGSFREELPNGTTKTVKPWEQSAVVGTPNTVVGRLVYGTLAEETNPVEQVAYEKSGTHVLLSKYSETDPLVEYTAAQALCIPVIDGVSSIYVLTTTASETDPTEP